MTVARLRRSAWGLEVERDLDWRQQAACSPANAEWFWIGSGCGSHGLTADNKAALKLCQHCPVIRECARDARTHPAHAAHIAGGVVWSASGTVLRV